MSELNSAEIGKKLKEIRKAKNLSQTDVAVKAGIVQSTYQRAEKGQGLTCDTIYKIALALEISLDELFELDVKRTGTGNAESVARTLAGIVFSDARFDKCGCLVESVKISRLHTVALEFCDPKMAEFLKDLIQAKQLLSPNSGSELRKVLEVYVKDTIKNGAAAFEGIKDYSESIKEANELYDFLDSALEETPESEAVADGKHQEN